MAKDMISPIDRGRLDRDFHFEKLAGFEWISDYFAVQAARVELEELVGKRNKIAITPVPKADRMDGLKASFEAYTERRQAFIRKFLAKYAGQGNDVFRYLDATVSLGTRIIHLPPALEWKEIAQAYDSLPEAEGTIPRKDQEKAYGKLTSRIRELEKEIEGFFPERFHGPNGTDVRASFTEFWADLQSRSNGAVTPEGWDLKKYGTPAECGAWKTLRILDFVAVKSRLSPYDPEA